MSDFPLLLRLPCLVVVFVALLRACPGLAQTFDASGLDRPTELAGTWLMKPGDDLAYAQPGYDDSGWTRVDVKHDLRDYVRGPHPAVVWYRLHLRTSPTQTDLALATHDVGPAYEIYANGSRILQLGRVVPYSPRIRWTRLLGSLPAQAVRSGNVVLAVRAAIPEWAWAEPDVGVHSTNLHLGNRDTLQKGIWLFLFAGGQLMYLGALLGFAISVAALALYTVQQRRIEYLWMLVAGLTGMLRVFYIFYVMLRPTPDWVGTVMDCSSVIRNLAVALMYFGFLRYKPSKWVRIYMAVVFPAAALMIFGAGPGWLPDVFYSIADLATAAVAFGLVAWIALRDARRGNREAYALLFSSLMGVGIYLDSVCDVLRQFPGMRGLANEIRSSWINKGLIFGPVGADTEEICWLLFWISLAVVLILRSNRISLAQSALESEIEAAGQVQEVILPKPGESIPGFLVHSVYRPAQQVGGDFFQVLPAYDGGLLLIVGDVAGKGLPAAMMVALVVGSIRTIAQFTNDPAAILGELNARLVGRTAGGFSTCLTAHFRTNGEVTLANAGHLPPYLDGQEVALSGSFPLGIIKNAESTQCTVQLAYGSRLTFYSDGLPEAQNEKGELLGFEGAQALSQLDAEAIVQAAIAFGQKDDITVVVIERESGPVAVNS